MKQLNFILRFLAMAMPKRVWHCSSGLTKTFEDKLQASAQRLAHQEDSKLHVPQNPMQQKRAYWGWVATPAAAVVGIVFGMSLHQFKGNLPDATLAQSTDTVRIFQPIRDTLYLTQVVEKERIVNKYIPMPEVAKAATKEPVPQPEECTSIQCDGINYAFLTSK